MLKKFSKCCTCEFLFTVKYSKCYIFFSPNSKKTLRPSDQFAQLCADKLPKGKHTQVFIIESTCFHALASLDRVSFNAVHPNFLENAPVQFNRHRECNRHPDNAPCCRANNWLVSPSVV